MKKSFFNLGSYGERHSVTAVQRIFLPLIKLANTIRWNIHLRHRFTFSITHLHRIKVTEEYLRFLRKL